ncbi:hypothetical protein MNV49_002166 [Pseudohyphozyma bogoriensis]|nr:hypothetical protein MNV49_002166 [Pseudohyphozyma bogoriensis]
MSTLSPPKPPAKAKASDSSVPSSIPQLEHDEVFMASHGPSPSTSLRNSGPIDRWFADLSHYESTLEDMATASLDTAFKEELSAIEQWFRVLSEAERTAALYSLLQSATQVQVRFFATVLMGMERRDPVAGGLMSPAAKGGMSMQDQMEAKLASLGNPPSPIPPTSSGKQLSPTSARFPSSASPAPGSYLSPHSAADELATQRAKLKQSAAGASVSATAGNRTSAPANLSLSSSGGPASGGLGGWKEESSRDGSRSPSPGRPTSSGGSDVQGVQPNGAHSGQHLSQSAQPPSTSSFLRSPANTTDSPYADSQLSPLVGGSWASMVNTPLVPMFGGPGEKGGGGTFGGLSSPGLDGVGSKLSSSSGNWRDGGAGGGGGGIVLDDVRKFRRSARVHSGSGGVSGGALGGMYDEATSNAAASHPQNQQRRVSPSQLTNLSMQQNAINLGLSGLPPSSHSQSQASRSVPSHVPPPSPGGLLQQQAAVAAQNNWRQGLGSPNNPNASAQLQQQMAALDLQNQQNLNGLHQQQHQNQLHQQQHGLGGLNNHGQHGHLSPSTSPFPPNSANNQLANLFALQQMQMQQLNLAAAGIALTPVQMVALQQQQQQQAGLLSPGGRGMGNMGMMGGMGGMGFGGMGSPMGMGGMGMMGGMPSPRRSPRANDRSPGGSNNKSSVPSATGSGSNPDEPLGMNLLADVPAWLRSLRLHKYTPNFESSNWKEMVMLDDAGLEAKGVSALGARRKLLKVFETVRGKMGMALPGDGAASSASTLAPPTDAGSTRSTSPASVVSASGSEAAGAPERDP